MPFTSAMLCAAAKRHSSASAAFGYSWQWYGPCGLQLEDLKQLDIPQIDFMGQARQSKQEDDGTGILWVFGSVPYRICK